MIYSLSVHMHGNSWLEDVQGGVWAVQAFIEQSSVTCMVTHGWKMYKAGRGRCRRGMQTDDDCSNETSIFCHATSEIDTRPLSGGKHCSDCWHQVPVRR